MRDKEQKAQGVTISRIKQAKTTVKRIVHTTSAKIEDHRGTDKERTTDCEE
jgi:hypothetical protein